MSASEAQAFPLGAFGLNPQGDFAVLVLLDHNITHLHAYSARELALFTRAFVVMSDGATALHNALGTARPTTANASDAAPVGNARRPKGKSRRRDHAG